MVGIVVVEVFDGRCLAALEGEPVDEGVDVREGVRLAYGQDGGRRTRRRAAKDAHLAIGVGKACLNVGTHWVVVAGIAGQDQKILRRITREFGSPGTVLSRFVRVKPQAIAGEVDVDFADIRVGTREHCIVLFSHALDHQRCRQNEKGR